MDRPKRPDEDKHLESRDRPRAKRRKTSDDGGEVAIYDEERVEHQQGQDAEPIENSVFPTPRPTVSPERVVGGEEEKEEEKEGEKEEGGVSGDGQNETDDDSDNDSVGLPSLDLFQWPAGDYDPLLPIPDILLRPSSPSSHDSDSDSGYSSDASSSSSSPALPFEGAVSPPFPWGSPAPFLPATFFPLPPLPGQGPHPEPAPVVPHHDEHHEAQVVMGLLTPALEAELQLNLALVPNDGFALPPPALEAPLQPGWQLQEPHLAQFVHGLLIQEIEHVVRPPSQNSWQSLLLPGLGP